MTSTSFDAKLRLDEDGFRPLIVATAQPMDETPEEIEQTRPSAPRDALYQQAILNSVREAVAENQKPLIIDNNDASARRLRIQQERNVKLIAPIHVRTMQDVYLALPTREVQIRMTTAVVSGEIRTKKVADVIAETFKKEPVLLQYTENDGHEESHLYAFVAEKSIVFERTFTLKKGLSKDCFTKDSRYEERHLCDGYLGESGNKMGVTERYKTIKSGDYLEKEERLILFFSENTLDVDNLLPDEEVTDNDEKVLDWQMIPQESGREFSHELSFSETATLGKNYVEITRILKVPIDDGWLTKAWGAKYTHRRAYSEDFAKLERGNNNSQVLIAIDQTTSVWDESAGAEQIIATSLTHSPRHRSRSRSRGTSSLSTSRSNSSSYLSLSESSKKQRPERALRRPERLTAVHEKRQRRPSRKVRTSNATHGPNRHLSRRSRPRSAAPSIQADSAARRASRSRSSHSSPHSSRAKRSRRSKSKSVSFSEKTDSSPEPRILSRDGSWNGDTRYPDSSSSNVVPDDPSSHRRPDRDRNDSSSTHGQLPTKMTSDGGSSRHDTAPRLPQPIATRCPFLACPLPKGNHEPTCPLYEIQRETCTCGSTSSGTPFPKADYSISNASQPEPQRFLRFSVLTSGNDSQNDVNSSEALSVAPSGLLEQLTYGSFTDTPPNHSTPNPNVPKSESALQSADLMSATPATAPGPVSSVPVPNDSGIAAQQLSPTRPQTQRSTSNIADSPILCSNDLSHAMAHSPMVSPAKLQQIVHNLSEAAPRNNLPISESDIIVEAAGLPTISDPLNPKSIGKEPEANRGSSQNEILPFGSSVASKHPDWIVTPKEVKVQVMVNDVGYEMISHFVICHPKDANVDFVPFEFKIDDQLYWKKEKGLSERPAAEGPTLVMPKVTHYGQAENLDDAFLRRGSEMQIPPQIVVTPEVLKIDADGKTTLEVKNGGENPVLVRVKGPSDKIIVEPTKLVLNMYEQGTFTIGFDKEAPAEGEMLAEWIAVKPGHRGESTSTTDQWIEEDSGIVAKKRIPFHHILQKTLRL